MAKILIVDDDPDIVEASRLVLQKQGYEVACRLQPRRRHEGHRRPSSPTCSSSTS